MISYMGMPFQGDGRMLAEDIAAPSPEPEGSDIVEVYSFNTGEPAGASKHGGCISAQDNILLAPTVHIEEIWCANKGHAKLLMHIGRCDC